MKTKELSRQVNNEVVENLKSELGYVAIALNNSWMFVAGNQTSKAQQQTYQSHIPKLTSIRLYQNGNFLLLYETKLTLHITQNM